MGPEYGDIGDTAPTPDVRVLRTRRKLHTAVLGLAASGPVESVTVSDLTRAAGINRTTFYKHAESPGDALEQALAGELAVLKADFEAQVMDPSVPLPELWERALLEFADYIARHERLWSTALLGEGSPFLVRLLGRHFSENFSVFLKYRPAPVPAELLRGGRAPGGSAANDLVISAYGRFIGHGVTGIVQSWLEAPPPHDPGLFVSIVMSAMPSSFLSPPGSSGSGAPTQPGG